LHDDEPI